MCLSDSNNKRARCPLTPQKMRYGSVNKTSSNLEPLPIFLPLTKEQRNLSHSSKRETRLCQDRFGFRSAGLAEKEAGPPPGFNPGLNLGSAPPREGGGGQTTTTQATQVWNLGLTWV